MLLFILLIAIIIFDILAIKWGKDSTDTIDSSEWERRRFWHFRSINGHE